MPNSQKGFSPVLIVLLIGVLAIGGYYFYSKFSQQSSVPVNTNIVPTTIPSSSSWKIFKNDERGYWFSYPETFEISSGGGMEFSTDNIVLFSDKERLPYFGVESVAKSDLQSPNYQFIKATSAYEVINNSYEKAISNKNTYVKTIEPVHEILFSGKKAYTYKVEASGVDTIYGESMKDDSVYTFIATENKDSLILISLANFKLFDQILSTFKLTQPSGKRDYPVYPRGFLTKVEGTPACSSLSSEDAERAKIFLKCDSTQYRYIVITDSFDKVVNWYSNDESKSGWKLSGGGGVEGIERYGKLSNGDKDYWINIGIDKAGDKEAAFFEIRIH